MMFVFILFDLKPDTRTSQTTRKRRRTREEGRTTRQYSPIPPRTHWGMECIRFLSDLHDNGANTQTREFRAISLCGSSIKRKRQQPDTAHKEGRLGCWRIGGAEAHPRSERFEGSDRI